MTVSSTGFLSVASPGNSVVVTAVSPGSSVITVRTKNGGHTATSTIIVNDLTNAQPPLITQHPQLVTYVPITTAVALTVVANSTDGGVLSYQWFSNTTNSNTGGIAISGETHASLIPPTSAVGVLYYYVVVTNTISDNGDGGTKTATTTSNVARVEVTPPPIPIFGCNQNIPNWGSGGLGAVTFHSQGHNVVIQGTGANAHITQIWSGAVTATACQKETFNGGEPGNLLFNANADCRSNPGFPGDLFSWCAVMRFQHLLCPAPWRVPTLIDFFRLDQALGGTGIQNSPQFVANNYINRWGGAFGGSWDHNNEMSGQGSSGLYWSQSGSSVGGGGLIAYGMTFLVDGDIRPRTGGPVWLGFTLRCVRD